jgi:cytolysin-activating lysine-acyltransferase
MKSNQNFQVIGEVIYLMSLSSIHRYFKVIDINHYILPAIKLNQFRIYRNRTYAVGFVSWAYFSDEVEKQYTSGPVLLNLEDWQSGNNLFFIDFIAPFGHATKISRDLRNNVFPQRRVAKALRFKEPGNLHKVATYHGKTYHKTNSLLISQ